MWTVQWYENGVRNRKQFTTQALAKEFFDILVVRVKKSDGVRNVDFFGPGSF